MHIEPWMLMGGIIGTVLVVGSILIPKRIGFASYFSMLVTGQLVGSVICDAVGLFGAEVHMPGPARILGVILLLAGALLVQKR
ncbi:MAG: DMT family transporter [Firmicutes bacterium]|nr:DMT family transporter [Bacillota bacterium]